uniref:Uncharacterized protein n=1 Tax=Caudovirales sp. ctSH72 TaxID=2826773 RepID=A0A8S5QP00_9CAUD|nr:MAG TPA: hypothetical protein [Caudovirales sp. ctSH72]
MYTLCTFMNTHTFSLSACYIYIYRRFFAHSTHSAHSAPHHID